MLEIKNTKITNYEDEQKARGTGQLKSRRELNTKNFYEKVYNKFKTNNQLYLDDKMWTTAATRGELNNLIYLLNENKTENEGLEALKSWGMGVDYDTYMLALSIPTLDNEKKKTRLNEAGDYSFGDLTDQEWAKKVLEATNNKYQAEYVEKNKENMDWWQKAGAGIVSFVGHIATGIVGAAQNAFNLGEGIYNFVTGGDFLEAWADDDDEFLANVYEQMKYAMWELDRITMPWVDAVKANEEGYTTIADNIELGSKAFTEGIRQTGYGGGLTTWGRWWQSGLQSFGEMLPFMIAPAVNIAKFPKFSKVATKIIKTGGFYTTNVFSASIGDTVKTAQLNGISYKDLNAGEVVGNAALKTVGQYIVEVLLGKVLGFSGLDAMMGVGDDVAGAAKWFTKAASATGVKAAGVALGRGALSMVKEGLEEVLQDMSDNMIDMFFGGDYAEQAKENLTWQNIGDAFVVGALTSGVIGTLSSASVIINRNARTIAIDEKTGKAYRMGVFQQLNYNQAMQAMSSWQETLNNKNASIQDKADAAFRMNGVVATVGNVLKTFGSERAQKALELLSIYQNKESTAEQKTIAKATLSNVEYAETLYKEFVVGTVQANLKFDQQVELKKQLKKSAEELKKNNVTKITDIVTQELNAEDTTTDISDESTKAIKQLLKATKSEMVVATDGVGVVKSGDVIFAEESLVKNGKVSEILQGIAYDKAVKAIAPELSKKQNDLILEEYKKLTGRQDATIDDAVVALLFDKSFYTYILLKTNETQSINDANDAIKILAIMDSIVKGKIAGDVDKGTLTQAAYQKLVERIQENMRAGLVVYAINYTNIDLDAISAEILPASYKELIRNNENVIATNTINRCLESKQRGVITQTRIEEFNRQIDKFIGKNVIINDLIAEAKEKIKSPEYNDRYDACGLLRYLINTDIDVQLTFLKSDMATKAMGAENNTITLVTEFFDADWDSLVNGQIKFEELPEDAQEYITKAGYDINNYNDRIAMLRERLYTFSNNTLTVSYNGEVLQILDKNKLVKKEYLGEKGNEKLLADIQDGKIKKVKDICKITINETIGELDLVLNPNISSNGYFSENNPTRIVISGINIVNTIMHEATHATQYYIRPENVTTMSTGASLEHLQNVKVSVLNKIERYIEKTFPTTYTAMMQNPHINIPSIIYFNVDGEMQAMCKLTNLIFESGFTWNADKTKIYSPDGKTSWDLELKTDKRKSKGVIKDEKQSSSISNVNDRRFSENAVEQSKKLGEKSVTTKSTESAGIRERFVKIDGYSIKKINNVHANIKNTTTNKTIDKLKSKYGINIQQFNGYIINDNNEVINGFGFTDGKEIYIRDDLSATLTKLVVKHEYFHIRVLEDIDSYNNLVDIFKNNIDEDQLRDIIHDYSIRYNGLTAEEVLEEILADFSAGVIQADFKNILAVKKAFKALFKNRNTPDVQSKTYEASNTIKLAKDPNEKLLAITGFSSIKGLISQIERGYITAPSIAINSSLTNKSYGSMYFVYNKNVIDRALKNKQVYARDSYTGRRLDSHKVFKNDKATVKQLMLGYNRYINGIFSDNQTFINILRNFDISDSDDVEAFVNGDIELFNEFNRLERTYLTNKLFDDLYNNVNKTELLKTLRQIYESYFLDELTEDFAIFTNIIKSIPETLYIYSTHKNYSSYDLFKVFKNEIRDIEKYYNKAVLARVLEVLTTSKGNNFIASTIEEYIDEKLDSSVLNDLTSARSQLSKSHVESMLSNEINTIDSNIRNELTLFNADKFGGITFDEFTDIEEALLRTGIKYDMLENAVREQYGFDTTKFKDNLRNNQRYTYLSDEQLEDANDEYLLTHSYAGSFYERSRDIPDLLKLGYDKLQELDLIDQMVQYVELRLRPTIKTAKQLQRHSMMLEANSTEKVKAVHYLCKFNYVTKKLLRIASNLSNVDFTTVVNTLIQIGQIANGKKAFEVFCKNLKISDFAETMILEPARKMIRNYHTTVLNANKYNIPYLETKPSERLYFGTDISHLILDETSAGILNDLDVIGKIKQRGLEIKIYDSTDSQTLTNIFKSLDNNKLMLDFERKDYRRKNLSQISESRKISNEYARQSNLKYFIKKGQPIQLDERVQEFVINTTDDFDKLEPVIQKAIKNGSLTLLDIQNYVETANSMNDYTFKMIAKYIYENEEVAKLTYKEMIEILEHLEEIDTLKLFLNKSEVIDKKMSYTKMLKAYNKIKEDAKTNKKTAEALAGYTNLAETIKPANSRQFIPYEADIDQLHGAFFRHYNGTIRSVSGLNNLGKNIAHNQEALSLSENEGEGANLKSRKTGTWNWIDRIRKADINYGNVEQLTETLSDIDRQDKINIIQEHIIQSIIEQSKVNNWSQEQVLEEFNSQRDRLDDLSDTEIDKLYMAATSEGIIETTPDYMNVKAELEKRYVRKDSKEYKGKYASRITARATAKQAGRRVAQKLAGMKTRYNMLPPEVQELFDRKADGHYELNTKYQDMSDADLEAIIPKLQEANKRLAERIRFVEAAKKSKLNAIKRANRQAERMLDTPTGTGKKTMREKVDVVHKVVMKQEEFDFVSREQAPSVVESVLATSWDKSRTTTVQGLNNNIDQNIANAETFYTNNTDMLNMSLADAEQAAKWFMDAKLTGTMTSQDAKKFEAVQLYFLGYILEETRENGQFADLNNNIKTQIENFLRDKATSAGTALAVWNNIRKRLNPLEVMISQSVVIGGVELNESEQRELFTAAQQGDMETVAKLQQRTLERIKKEAGTKKKFLRRVTAVRSMSMLSSPLTWLRNIVSNFMLKRLNKWSSAIGNKVFTSKTKSGQLKFTGNITPEIQKFINDNFIDNKLFETLVSNISKYNPSEVSKKFKNKDGSIDKTAILANMVIKSMYGQYYSENMFKSNFMNKTYQGLMKMMSDNNYVREAAVRYFGKIIAEKGYDLSKGVTDQIMTDFANAIGIAMADYMHSDNFFNNLERVAADHGELTLFLYKNLLPFMSTSWNWFKAGIRYSPLGLVNSIIKLTRLENIVRKQTSKWKHGEAQVAPEYMEYLIRRDIGSGIIGTMAFGLGALLAALGFIDLDDDDYGVPKLVVGDLEVDISSIFGTSSVLAGAALIVDIRDQGLSWNTVLSGLDNMLDVYADGFFLTELMSLDMYAGGGSFATALDWAESFGLSFIPNGLAWLAGMTYTGTLRKKGFFGKAAAKVPFLAGLVNEKKVDPYTGETGNIWDIFNRVFPYFDIKMKSRTQETAESLGLSKKELRGQYTINNEEFNLSDKEVSEINKQYGEWNAKDLTAFLDDKEKYKVKDEATGNYKMLTYSQMTDKQRKNTISTIMENNAENAKILAWLNAGYKYYASANKYAELRQLGVKGKLYKGSKGFVKE